MLFYFVFKLLCLLHCTLFMSTTHVTGWKEAKWWCFVYQEIVVWRNDRERWRKKRASHQRLVVEKPKVKRGENRNIFLEECRHPLLIPFFIILSHNSLCNSFSCARGSCSVAAKPQLAAICSQPTSLWGSTSAWSLVSQRPKKPLKSVGHSREASHCFPVIRLVKVPPRRRKAWRSCSWVGDFSQGLILQAGSASPAQDCIAELCCPARV